MASETNRGRRLSASGTGAETTTPRRVTVLVEDPEIRAEISAVVSQLGCVVNAGPMHLGRLQAIRRSPPDAFLIGLTTSAPQVTEFCRLVREAADSPHVPVLAVIPDSIPDLVHEAFAVGCDDYFEWPGDPVVVRARLMGLIERFDHYNRLERIRINLARYISPRIRDLLEQDVNLARLGQPKQQDVCILFSDIRGFTALAQDLAPEPLFHKVSQHLGGQVDAVYRYGGYVDKFGGDGIMAVFDAPTQASDACHCAHSMIEVASLVPGLAPGVPLPFGIGIHRGPVLIGNIGSGQHLDYSVLGNHVNIAARLCGYADSRDIVVSQAVRDAVSYSPTIRFSEPEQVTLRGLSESSSIYRILPALDDDGF